MIILYNDNLIIMTLYHRTSSSQLAPISHKHSDETVKEKIESVMKCEDFSRASLKSRGNMH